MPHPSLKKIAYKPYSSGRRSSLQPRRPKKKWIGRLIVIGLALATLGFTSGLAVVAWYSRDLPDPSNLSRRTSQESTKILRLSLTNCRRSLRTPLWWQKTVIFIRIVDLILRELPGRCLLTLLRVAAYRVVPRLLNNL